MSVALTYPGVRVLEIPSGVRTISGVATSIAAFVGTAGWGPPDEPVTINNFGDFERRFGGLWAPSYLSYAVRHFYMNGGGQAIVIRLVGRMPQQQPSRSRATSSSLQRARVRGGTLSKSGRSGSELGALQCDGQGRIGDPRAPSQRLGRCEQAALPAAGARSERRARARRDGRRRRVRLARGAAAADVDHGHGR